MAEFRTTRRGLLAVAGAAVLPGCSLPLGGGVPTVDGTQLRATVERDVPTITRRFPVGVGEDRVGASAERVEALLARAPLPFDAATLPNGTMRQEMNRTADHARERLQAARDANSGAAALAALRDARGAARTVATAGAYIDEGLRRPDLEDDATTLSEDVAAFRGRLSYVGEDPVRAVVVHGAIEDLVRAATPDTSRRRTGDHNLVTVSEYAAELERSRAALDDAAHLSDRIDTPGARDLGGTFRTALDDLAGRLDNAVAGYGQNDDPLSYVDSGVTGTVAEHSLRLLYGDFTRHEAVADDRQRGDVASAILGAHRELIRVRAFELLRDRVEDDPPTLERAEDVATIRDAAVEAIETAMRTADHPPLARKALEALPDIVRRNDDEIAAGDEDQVPVDRVRRDVGEYLWAVVVARAVPAVNDAVAAALDTA